MVSVGLQCEDPEPEVVVKKTFEVGSDPGDECGCSKCTKR